MRFILLGMSVTMLLLLGIYLLNLFDVRSLENGALILLFVMSLAALLVSNEAIEKYGLTNPLYLIAPAFAVLFVCYVAGFRSIALAFALMMTSPAIVATTRWFIGREEKKT